MLFDLKKIANKKNISSFILFALLSFYFVYSGLSGYQEFLKEKENFIQYENLKFKQHRNYESYAALGFRILFHPTILTTFFNSSAFTKTESQIDVREMIKINNPKQGRALFQSIGNIKGLSDFIRVFGSLLFLYLGLTTFESLKEIQFYKKLKFVLKTVLFRLTHSIAFFLLLAASVLIFALVNGIDFSKPDLKIFSYYILHTLVFLSLWYIGGVLISLFTVKKRKLTFKIAFLIWLILIILVPELSNKFIENKAERIRSIEKMNIQKLSALMDFEKKSLEHYLEKIKDKTVDRQKLKREILASYLDTGYKANEELENVLFNEVKEMIFFVEKFSLIAPTTYYSFLSKEIAGEGYYSDLAFYRHIIQLKRKFMKFIIDNRMFSVRRKVEPFVKKWAAPTAQDAPPLGSSVPPGQKSRVFGKRLEGINKNDENIFQASSHLPRTFAAATGMNLFYMVLMLFFIAGKTRVYLRENRKKPFEGPFEFDKVNVGEIYYVFCGSEEKRDKLFDSLKGGETIAMDGVSPHDFDANIKLKDLLHLAGRIEGTDAEKAAVYMQQLGVAPESLTKKIEEVPAETFKKFFCAIKLAGAQNYIIISDYAAGAGKEFNQKFRNLLAHINKEEGKTILYLSGEMFDTLSYHQKAKETSENSEYKLFKLEDITAIAL